MTTKRKGEYSKTRSSTWSDTKASPYLFIIIFKCFSIDHKIMVGVVTLDLLTGTLCGVCLLPLLQDKLTLVVLTNMSELVVFHTVQSLSYMIQLDCIGKLMP